MSGLGNPHVMLDAEAISDRLRLRGEEFMLFIGPERHDSDIGCR